MKYKFSLENFEILLSENNQLRQEIKRLTIDYNAVVKQFNAIKKKDKKNE